MTFWMNKEEVEKFNKLCLKYKVTKTQMIRSIISLIVPPLPNKEMDQVIVQLRQIGNNLNQIARVANATSEIDTLAYKQNVDYLYSAIADIKECLANPSAVIEVRVEDGDN